MAANRLHVAQPAISRQIRDLENELGFSLFERVGRGIILTDAGKHYLEHVRRVLKDLDEAQRSAARIAEGRGGVLRIGLLENASWAGHAPSTLKRFARNHPDISLEIKPMSSVAQLELIAAGGLDGGFLYRQDRMDRSLHEVVPLRTDDVVFAASSDLVFDHENDLTLEDIEGLPLVGFPRDVAPSYFDRLHAALEHIGFEPHYAQLVENETIILSLVSAGVGCAFVNSANEARPPRNVQFRRVEGLSVPIDFLFVHRRPPGTTLSKFLATITE